MEGPARAQRWEGREMGGQSARGGTLGSEGRLLGPRLQEGTWP